MNKGFYVIYNIKILNYFSNKVQKKLSLLDCPQKVRHFLGAFFMRRKFELYFKLRIVRRYFEDIIGIDALSSETSTDRSLIRKSVKFYELYGVSGLARTRNSYYPVSFKPKFRNRKKRVF